MTLIRAILFFFPDYKRGLRLVMSTDYGILASHESGFVSVPLSLMLVTYRKDNFAEKENSK